jgi:hypothetical protein
LARGGISAAYHVGRHAPHGALWHVTALCCTLCGGNGNILGASSGDYKLEHTPPGKQLQCSNKLFAKSPKMSIHEVEVSIIYTGIERS